MLNSNPQNSLDPQSNDSPYTKLMNSENHDRILVENQAPEILLENQHSRPPQSKEEIHDEIRTIDRQLDTCWYKFYRVWIAILMVISFIGLILGAIVIFTGKFAYIYLVGEFGCAWNTKQLYEEYQAIAYRDILKAKKAMHYFKGFMAVIPMLFLMASMIEGLQLTTVIMSLVGIILVFYFFVVFGGQMVLKKLEHLEVLEKRLNTLLHHHQSR